MFCSLHDIRLNQALTAVNRLRNKLSRSDASVGDFFSNYVLGVITHMNDVLHDVQGRKTLQMKEQVLRGLCNLITQVGSLIVTVAPQVGLHATAATIIDISALHDLDYGHFTDSGSSTVSCTGCFD